MTSLFPDSAPFAFSDEVTSSGSEGFMACPRCGGPYMHLQPGAIATTKDVSIPCWCEYCGRVSRLQLLEHKGHIAVVWVLA
jgi:hypothetical protein